MRPRGVTLATVQKGYRDDSDGDDSLSQRQRQRQAPQLSLQVPNFADLLESLKQEFGSW